METTTAAAASTRLTIDVWADVLCPWCYLGEQRLSAAIAQSSHADDIELKVHTFQLDPAAPAEVFATLDYLSKKYGVSAAQARSMEEGMAGQAAAEGLRYEVDRPARNTFDLLRLVHLGAEYGLSWEYLRAMQTEVFSGNPDAFERDTLVRIGEEVGIPADEIWDVLATDRYADAVRADHDTAVALGARGVPFTVLGERLGIPGAVSVSEYASAIDQAWEQVHG
ncbi:DsbA family oxidoreductase [Nonomuraea sp. NPDC003709]|uniref:DsbA family oxidoreductase n=1 Tax=Nonomuraea sp. NPDC003709 TaxID=3154450 RepID=UPI0033A79790